MKCLPADFQPMHFSPTDFSPTTFSPTTFSPEYFSPADFAPPYFAPRLFSHRLFTQGLFTHRLLTHQLCKVSLFQLSISSMVLCHDCHQLVYRALTALFSSGLNSAAQGLDPGIVHEQYSMRIVHMVHHHFFSHRPLVPLSLQLNNHTTELLLHGIVKLHRH